MDRIQARGGALRIYAVLAALALLFFCVAASQAGQSDKKKKKNPPRVDNNSANPVIPLTDEQQIDYMISEVLGAWQLGDSNRMHKNYAEDVSVVRSDLEPPIRGWAEYEKAYKLQRATMQQVRMDRSSNTYIKVNGNSAWACFQWDFSAVINGAPSAAMGQTTYVFIKKDNHWLIAHDHTSVVQSSRPQAPAGAAPAAATPPKPAS